MTDRNDNKALFAFLSILAVLPLAAWKGWVLVQLWTWFMVPLGVPGMTIWHAAGLATLVGWMTDSAAYYANAHRDDDKRRPVEKFMFGLVVGVFVPLLSWGVGAVYHALM